MNDVPLGPMTIEKADLFFALVRLYQLLRDTSHFVDADDTPFISDTELVGEAEEEGEDGGESEIICPTPFSNFLDEHNYLIAELGNAYRDEFVNLFATLATPLLDEPRLKEEFRSFALEKFGENIVFKSAPPPKAKLTLVPSPPPSSPPSEPDMPPEPPKAES